MITIRREAPADIAAVHRLNAAAFETSIEADLVDVLRENCRDHLALVAEADGVVFGHILFTPLAIAGEEASLHGMGLAPMAVVADRQNEGIGSRLVRAGLDILRAGDCPFVVVLGHPQYYPRFGFTPAAGDGVTCQWDGVPDDAFLILWLDDSRRGTVRGVGRYREEFDAAM